ncbi:hypothetical protein HZA75_04950 [Candidatus Roizmanbacteria bacterium]|nr:hypothetical protein [Candidatus Roizmanbacteria bacterium]
MNLTIDQIIKSSIDLHYHIGPEVIPRKFDDVISLIKNQNNKIRGIALKNHFYPTVPFIEKIKKNNNLILIGSVVLNNFIGGLNPEVIYAASLINRVPIIVWFPTISAKNFLEKTKYEIAPEWVNKKNFKARLSKDVKGIYILDQKNNLNKKTFEVLKAIKKTNSILATGHISWQESKKLVKEALSIGIRRIIITHPIYQKINMPINIQKKLGIMGCFIEICYSMYSIDKIPIDKIVFQIKKIGYKNIILSSDVGQKFSPDPGIALYKFSNLLLNEGITLNMLYKMLVENPKKVIGI